MTIHYCDFCGTHSNLKMKLMGKSLDVCIVCEQRFVSLGMR